MHTYEVRDGDQVATIEADTWRRDLSTGEVVFVVRSLGDGRRPEEHEVLRLEVAHPHRAITRR